MGITYASEDTEMRVGKVFLIQSKWGMSKLMDVEGRILRRCVAIWRASTQYMGGR